MSTFNGAKETISSSFLGKTKPDVHAEINLILELHSHNGSVPSHFIIKGRFLEREGHLGMIFFVNVFCVAQCCEPVTSHINSTVNLVLKVLHVKFIKGILTGV